MYRREKHIKEKDEAFRTETKGYKIKNMKKTNVPAKNKTKERTDKSKEKHVPK